MSIQSIDLKFTSANSVPVERAVVTRDEWEAALSENEALRVERDELSCQLERLRDAVNTSGVYKDSQDICDALIAVKPQSLAHIRAAGARKALERAIQEAGFSGTVVRVDVMRDIIEQMEAG